MSAHRISGSDEQGPEPEDSPGLSRRSMLRGAAGVGAAGVAAGLTVGPLAGTAGAAPRSPEQRQAQASDEPVMAHVADARRGMVDLFVGERHVQAHHPALADALTRAAADAT